MAEGRVWRRACSRSEGRRWRLAKSGGFVVVIVPAFEEVVKGGAGEKRAKDRLMAFSPAEWTREDKSAPTNPCVLPAILSRIDSSS